MWTSALSVNCIQCTNANKTRTNVSTCASQASLMCCMPEQITDIKQHPHVPTTQIRGRERRRFLITSAKASIDNSAGPSPVGSGLDASNWTGLPPPPPPAASPEDLVFRSPAPSLAFPLLTDRVLAVLAVMALSMELERVSSLSCVKSVLVFVLAGASGFLRMALILLINGAFLIGLAAWLALFTLS